METITTNYCMEISRHWRNEKIRYMLMGNYCAECGNKMFPPRPICPKCNHPLHSTPDVENTIGGLQKEEEVISLT